MTKPPELRIKYDRGLLTYFAGKQPYAYLTADEQHVFTAVGIRRARRSACSTPGEADAIIRGWFTEWWAGLNGSIEDPTRTGKVENHRDK